ncbi:MAG: hypothetical protein JWP94_950 [Mucilaginibacter sp.]|nr:hypothetical protein [Mucilaginibacter sp.]
MKPILKTITSRPLLLMLSAVTALSISLSSCKKSSSSASLSAYVMVTNSAQGSTPQDFYLDNNKLNSSAMAYSQSSAFITTSAGSHQGQFKASGTGTVDATTTLSLAAGKYYDVFYTDGGSATTAEDDRTAPQSGKSRVRFINLSSALTSNIDIAATGSANLISALAYKAASAYYDVDPATAFSLKASNSSTVLLSIPSAMQAGHVYTVYFSGTTSATIAANVITEK